MSKGDNKKFFTAAVSLADEDLLEHLLSDKDIGPHIRPLHKTGEADNKPVARLQFRNKETKNKAFFATLFPGNFPGTLSVVFETEERKGENWKAIPAEKALSLVADKQGYVDLVFYHPKTP